MHDDPPRRANRLFLLILALGIAAALGALEAAPASAVVPAFQVVEDSCAVASPGDGRSLATRRRCAPVATAPERLSRLTTPWRRPVDIAVDGHWPRWLEPPLRGPPPATG